MALSSIGSIVCIGPSSAVERFSAIQPENFFQHRTYSWSARLHTLDDNNSKATAEYEFRLLLPARIKTLHQAYDNCKWKIKVRLEGRLEDWFDVEEFKDLPTIRPHPDASYITGRETIKGTLIIKDNQISEDLLIGERLGIKILTEYALDKTSSCHLILVSNMST